MRFAGYDWTLSAANEQSDLRRAEDGVINNKR